MESASDLSGARWPGRTHYCTAGGFGIRRKARECCAWRSRKRGDSSIAVSSSNCPAGGESATMPPGRPAIRQPRSGSQASDPAMCAASAVCFVALMDLRRSRLRQLARAATRNSGARGARRWRRFRPRAAGSMDSGPMTLADGRNGFRTSQTARIHPRGCLQHASGATSDRPGAWDSNPPHPPERPSVHCRADREACFRRALASVEARQPSTNGLRSDRACPMPFSGNGVIADSVHRIRPGQLTATGGQRQIPGQLNHSHGPWSERFARGFAGDPASPLESPP